MIPYVRDMDFAYGRADPVSPLIRRVVANNPGPFTFLGTGTYIVGHGEVAVIDPGPDLPEHLEAILKAVAGETVKAILVTHNHADHSPLAAPLKAATGAAIYGCPLDHTPAALSVQVEDDHDTAFRPDVNLCAGGRVEGPGWSLEAIPTPGHTSNHLCFALSQENAIFTGDHIMGWSTTVIVPPDGDMGDYYDSLRVIAGRAPSVLWPTHGPPVADPLPFIGAYVAHRVAREGQILEMLGRGVGRIRDMVPVMYAAVDPRLHPAAAMSVLAHMIQLVKQGVVVSSESAPTLDSDYRLA